MSAKQIVALLNSHVEGDEELFLSIVLQAAAQAARSGSREEAETLKRLVQKARDQRRAGVMAGPTPIPLARPRSELQGLVESHYPHTTLEAMVLDPITEARLKRLLLEQRQRATLRDHGRRPATHVLLVGPPGTGKTMTASALAGELRLPLFTVRLDAVFSRYLGETASKLRVLFDQVGQTRGVYLLDEFDALGARRGEANDVGEVRRVLNSVLTFMEEPNSTDSLIVSATNHVGMLDEALARRFDEVIEYDIPNAEAAKAVIERQLGAFKLNTIQWSQVTKASQGLSQGELVRAADSVVKHAILSDEFEISADQLLVALQERTQARQRFNPKVEY